MKHENENVFDQHKGLTRREFLVMLAGFTAGLLVPSLSGCQGENTADPDTATAKAPGTATTTAPNTATATAPNTATPQAPNTAIATAPNTATATTTAANTATATAASFSDRLGKLLPLRKLGSSGPAVTNLGLGGDHVGGVSEKEAQAIIEKALEEGVRFFDNAPLYSGGRAEERYGKFLTPNYRDVSFIMTKTLARSGQNALRDLDNSLSRMKTDYVDLWQVHAIESPSDVERRIQNGVLDAFLEAQEMGKTRYIGFTGHASYKAHLKMLEELEQRGVKMVSSQMPVNPADPHFESFVTHVVPKCVQAGIGVLAMKTLAYGRFFGGNKGWLRTDVSVEPIIPDVLSLDDVFGFVWSLPITTLISGMESVQQVSQNAAIARKTWNWEQAERQKRIDALVSIAGPDLEFYKD